MVVGLGYTTQLRVPAKAPAKTATVLFSKPNSSSTLAAPTRSFLLAPRPQRARPKVARCTLTLLMSTSSPTSLTPNRKAASQSFAVKLAAVCITRAMSLNTSLLALPSISSTSMLPDSPISTSYVTICLSHPHPLTAVSIPSHQVVRGRGGFITVLTETHWSGLSYPSWERESDLHCFYRHILLVRCKNTGTTSPSDR